MQRIKVDTSRVLARIPRDCVGINLDYLRDNNANRPDARPIEEALLEMGVKWLRYPGGGKSDHHLWSVPPYERPDPQTFGSYRQYREGHDVLDFDQYMACARTVGATPYVVAGYDRADRSGISREQYLENAVEWVRYANVTKGYGVRHWEIGNENWGYEKGTPEEIAEVVVQFSRSMKAVDPDIFVGASGFNPEWWREFLPVVAPNLDFLVVSNYPCSTWMGYDYYRTHPEVVVAEQVSHAADGIAAFAPEADRERLCVIVTELNSMDYATDGWPNRNNLGHALVTVEIFGQVLLNPKVRAAMLWNTRWVDPEPETIWYGLDPANRILPSGRAMAVWGQFLRDALVTVDRTDAIVTFATVCDASGELNLLLINKDYAAVEIALDVQSARDYGLARAFRFHGQGPDDMNPTWEELPSLVVRDHSIPVVKLPGVSLTVLSLTPALPTP